MTRAAGKALPTDQAVGAAKRRARALIKRTEKIKKAVPAAYSPEGRAMCPSCWSRPSLTDTHHIRNETRKRGWGAVLTGKTVTLNGKAMSVMKTKYICANTECGTVFTVNFTTSFVPTPEEKHALPWVRKHRLRGKEAEKFSAGGYVGDIWVSDAPPPPPPVEAEPVAAPTKEVTFEIKAPWLYIGVRRFKDKKAIPAHWTRDEKKRIKTRIGTDRHRQIQEWFANRDITVP
jgi:hypothetical protein